MEEFRIYDCAIVLALAAEYASCRIAVHVSMHASNDLGGSIARHLVR
jgi:hypothetical protein